MRYPYGTLELQLSKDGTYRQRFTLKGSSEPPIQNTGKWKLRVREGGIRRFWETDSGIHLEDALDVDDHFGHLSPDYHQVKHGLSHHEVRKSLSGKVYIVENDDIGLYFEKK